MIDAKLKGEGIDRDAVPEPTATNVIDLMAALRKSIAESEVPPATAKSAPAAKAKTPQPAGAPKATRKRVS
jgi:non-homologous end joining protein Ku